MKKLFLSVACATLMMVACNNKEEKTEEATTETTTEVTEAPAADSTEASEEGGSVEVNKEGVTIEGKDGGSMEINKDGMKIEGKDDK